MNISFDIVPILAELETTTAAQKSALEKLFERDADVRDSARSLKEREAELTTQGLEGNNDKQRAAFLFEATGEERDALTLMEEHAARVKLALQKADLDLKLARSKAQLISAYLGFKTAE